MPVAESLQSQDELKIIKGRVVKVFPSKSPPKVIQASKRKGLITKVDENGIVEQHHKIAPWLEAWVLQEHPQPPAMQVLAPWLKHRTHKNNHILDKVSVPAEQLNDYLKYMNGIISRRSRVE